MGYVYTMCVLRSGHLDEFGMAESELLSSPNMIKLNIKVILRKLCKLYLNVEHLCSTMYKKCFIFKHTHNTKIVLQCASDKQGFYLLLCPFLHVLALKVNS